MSLFQKSVLNKYLDEQDNNTVQEAYVKFKDYFHNTQIQHNIRESKEEQFQEGFLRELFVVVFGYVLNPQPDFNLTTEYKNEKGAKKADGAILKDGKAIAVIELKSTKTKDLESIRQQAFDYKANQSECVYVITSNFHRLRFYVNNAVEFEEFDLFTLSEDRFKLLFLCLKSENLLSDLSLKIKNASLLEEENITKKFYADYSLFKKELFENIAAKNTELQGVSKLQLYKRTQKLLDRFLFIFFAEDRGLLPPNSISRMIKRWNVLNDEDAYKPLYDIYKQYFGYLNIGRNGKVPADDIQAYNGGLFLPDEVLDSIEIDDEVLLKHTSILTNYDFDSQVDVNILGHIFEHSLNEIESTTAQLEGVDFDKQKSKRKKDGVFYTPKYITKYIVDNTVGKLCEEKKTELDIIDEEFTPSRNKETKKRLLIGLEAYRSWLLELTICDPACGSGAFLNQALEFLINEHFYIDNLNAQLFGSAMVFQDVENQILEKNIFGVDINEESVDIARLSLWLRTAQRGRKLTTLNKNIKCGNSLIDDPEVAGEKAFNWEKEFPEVFERGGFNVVVGNPPYVNLERMTEVSSALEKLNYLTYNKKGDLYTLFVEKGFSLLREDGAISYIMSNKWLQAGYGKNLREFFLSKQLERLIDLRDIQIFAGATTYPCVFIAKNSSPKKSFFVSVLKSTNSFDFDTIVSANEMIFYTNQFSGETWVISSQQEKQLLTRINESFPSLQDYVNGEAYYGIKFGLTEAFLIDEKKKNMLIEEDPTSKELIGAIARGRDITRYGKPKKTELDSIVLAGFGSYKYLQSEYPAIYRHIVQFESKLKKRGQCTGSKETLDKPFTGQHHWLELDNNPSEQYLNLYKQPKIMYQKFQVKPCFIFDEQGLYCNDSMWIIPTDDKVLLGILNSKMGWWLITKYCTQIQNGCQLIWKYFGKIPIPELTNPILEESVELMIDYTSSLQSKLSKFITYIQSQFSIEKLPKKLKNWHELEFGEFIKELNKVIRKAGKDKLSKMDEMEWMEVFEIKIAEAQTLKAEIDKTDNEINQMVYELYGLTEDEIMIVELT